MLTVLIITWHLGQKISEVKETMSQEAYYHMQAIRSLNVVEDEYDLPVLDGTEVKLA